LAPAGGLPWQRPLAALLALVLVLETAYLLFIRTPIGQGIAEPTEAFGDPGAVGLVLFNQYLLPIQITGILLLVAMIGAIVLTKPHREKKGGDG
jgi:NADH-quinone oxidoreductase subunit J